MEHMLSREVAVADCADQLVSNYEELNMLYSLLSSVATKVDEQEVGQVIVDHAVETLNCRRVSLLAIDEEGKSLKVVAAKGIPAEVHDLTIPIAGSVAGSVVSDAPPLIAGHMGQYPDLAELSNGTYDGDTFAVIRVPMQARGRPVGVLTATERNDGGEFTARDHKLLQGLSAMGAASLMNCRLHAAVNEQMMSTIKALACAVDAKDRYTHDHSGRVSRLCVMTARRLGINDRQSLRSVELAGLLHDIGKIGIPDAILCKPGRLTAEEFSLIKSHPSIGGRIVRKVNGLEDVAVAIEHHHERHDGMGYPAGLAGEDIPLLSKLLSVADTFDSLTSNRSYREATAVEDALQEILRCTGTQFDPKVAETFCAVVTEAAASEDSEEADVCGIVSC
jgi:putative nucleotidyltransferase with HDIG domain